MGRARPVHTAPFLTLSYVTNSYDNYVTAAYDPRVHNAEIVSVRKKEPL